MLGRVLRTGLSSLRDRAANLRSRLAALRFNPSRIWEETVLIVGYIALFCYISNNHKAPDPLPLAILACLILVGRMKDRVAP